MLEALQAFGPAAWFRSSFILYPLVNALHILAIGVLVTAALLMDLRVLGVARKLPVETVIAHLRPVAIGALAVAVLSGAALFSVQPVDYFANPAFRIKLLLLVLALANAAVFTTFRLHREAAGSTGKVLAAASAGLWISVLVSGRFVGFLA
ncbi:MAG TPA: hypothetical protein PK286_10690 [Devosia sp.]|nr:hypothetical protein [Devosia sp.]